MVMQQEPTFQKGLGFSKEDREHPPSWFVANLLSRRNCVVAIVRTHSYRDATG